MANGEKPEEMDILPNIGTTPKHKAEKNAALTPIRCPSMFSGTESTG